MQTTANALNKHKRVYRINMLDAMALLYNVYAAARHEEIGFVDCERTLYELTLALSADYVEVPQDVMESALWSANMMNEVKEFWHPYKRVGFDRFTNKLISTHNVHFDEFYNVIIEGKKKWKRNKKEASSTKSVEESS